VWGKIQDCQANETSKAAENSMRELRRLRAAGALPARGGIWEFGNLGIWELEMENHAEATEKSNEHTATTDA